MPLPYEKTSLGLEIPAYYGGEEDARVMARNLKRIDALLTAGAGAVSLGSDPAANRAAIQSALDGGGRVVVDAGGSGQSVYIDNTLYIGDDTSLSTAVGTTLAMQSNLGGKLMLGTKASLIAPTPVNITWASGNTVNMAWAGHGLQVGDAVVLQGANEAAWWDVVRVTAVVDAGNVTLMMPFLPSAAPTGSVTARRCNRRVAVDVTVDYGFSRGNNLAGQNLDRMAVCANFVADSRITVRASDVYKYGLMVSGADNVTAESVSGQVCRSDTLKGYGPLNNVRLTAEGAGPEDCLTVQALEPGAFIAYMPCQGNMRNVVLHPRAAKATTAGSAPVVVYTDDRYKQDVRIEGGEVRALGGTMPGLFLRPGNTFAMTASGLTRCVVEDLLMASAGGHVFRTDTKARSITLRRPRFEFPSAGNTYLGNIAGQIENFVIEDATIDRGSWPATTGATYGFYFGGTDAAFEVITLRRVNLAAAAGALRFILVNAPVKTIVLEDCVMASFDSVLRLQSAGITVVIRGGSYTGLNIVNFLGVPGRVVVQGAPVFNNLLNGIARADGAAAVVDIDADSAPAMNGSSVTFTAVNSGKVNIRSDRLSVNIGATGVNKAAGNRAFNTTAQGTIPANVPVVCDGASWFNATNLSQTF